MQHKVLVDYELAVAQQGFIVRALLKLEGKTPSPDNRIPLNLSIVLDRSGSMGGEKLAAARDAAAMLIRRRESCRSSHRRARERRHHRTR
jgi:hypothetical protein